jgi:CrcB protein
MKEFLLVFAGGGLGSVARFLVSKFFSSWQPLFPFATLTSNFLSCVIFGLVIILCTDRLNVGPTLKLLMLTGFCGGFSTYSSFTFETVELFKNGHSGMALSNVFLNFFLSVGGLYLGFAIAKFL